MATTKRSENVTYSGTATDCLLAAMQDTMAPDTVAVIAHCLRRASESLADARDIDHGPDVDRVRREIDWLRETLIDLLGPGEYEYLLGELGL